jgi:hypothetical protein
MDTRTQDVPGYYVWEVPGRPVVVHLRLDVVDRLAAEVMRGFGAVPKRGAEVGGVLVGTIQQGVPAIVRIEDFEPVPCEYRRGPSYLFTEEDGAAFEDAWQRFQPGVSPSSYAVGYFRSHTRDGLALASEDIELLDHFFPGPAHVALLIKPFATRVSIASFFVREHGGFPENALLEFPFRRRELTGEEAPPRRSLLERRPRTLGRSPAALAEGSEQTEFGFAAPERIPSAEPVRAAATLPKTQFRGGWVWILLSFIFLLLGGALGFQAALTMRAPANANSAQNFSLSLSVARSGDNLNVKWDGQSPAIRAAQKGLLEIEDGGRTKPVDMDPVQLRSGSLIYRNSSKSVRFRLTVYPKARVSVTETMEWKQ